MLRPHLVGGLVQDSHRMPDMPISMVLGIPSLICISIVLAKGLWAYSARITLKSVTFIL